MSAALVTSLLTAVLSGVLAWLLTPVLRPFLKDDSERVLGMLRAPVAAVAALSGFGAANLAHSAAEMVAFAAVGVGCALLVVVDLMVRRLPDVLVAGTTVALLVPLALAAAISDEWSALGRSLLAAVVLLAVYFLLALIAPNGLGLGDVKFAFVVGGFLGWFGWNHVLMGTVLGFIINGAVALVVLLVVRGGSGMQIPFGPSMVLGAVSALALLR